jgi:polyisoprenoid-binding protein YceI
VPVERWTLDPDESVIRLEARALWGLLPVRGTFGGIRGEGTVTTDGATRGQLVIASASIDTGLRRRDRHLRSDDYLACQTFPDITVDIDRLFPEANQWIAEGRLTARDRHIDLTLPCRVDVEHDRRATVEATVIVDRSRLGVDFRARGATKMDTIMSVRAVFLRDISGTKS